MSFEPILLTPEEEPEEIFPYRRVWRTSSLEVLVVFLVVFMIWLLTDLFGMLPADLTDIRAKTGIALLPLAAWLVFSYRGERRALKPRFGLIGVLILGGLVANGIAVPLEERVFTPERWLPYQGFFGRVLGYMFTIGFTAEFLKYAVLRYTVWPQRLERRVDGMAFAITVSLGFAVVYNLRFALYTDATLLATALRVASIMFSQIAAGLIMGYFLVELRIGHPPIFWIPAGLFLASFISGLYYGFRGIAIVSGLNVGADASSPVRGLALALGLIVMMYITMAFIIESADTRMITRTGRREEL
ncbi:MAG: PrsW family intramembrane metalloprotease [Anaerolineae bacterium]|nr:PrsW family intramembrane metalloprotease [Anaerolineae bacterium]